MCYLTIYWVKFVVMLTANQTAGMHYANGLVICLTTLFSLVALPSLFGAELENMLNLSLLPVMTTAQI